MKSRLLTLLIVASANMASATEIPLPGLVGEYNGESGFARVVTVELDVAPTAVESLSLYLKGRTTTGQLTCFGSEDPSTYPAELLAFIYDAVSGAFWYVDLLYPELGEPLQAYEFEMTTSFRSFRDSNWVFLAAGSFKLEFSAAGPPYIGICSAQQSPVSTIDDAVLIVNLAAHQVQVESKSWGGIKALY